MFNFYLRKTTIVAMLLAAMANNSSYSFNTQHNGLIDNFNPIMDMTTILSMVHQNSYWLIKKTSIPYLIGNNGAFSILLTGTYNDKPVTIKVLREGNATIGFIAYYMENQKQGYVLALAVKEELRKNGYAHTLIRYAMNELFTMGAHNIVLWTRSDNFPAYNLYKKLGFTETVHPHGATYDGFIYLTCPYTLDSAT